LLRADIRSSAFAKDGKEVQGSLPPQKTNFVCYVFCVRAMSFPEINLNISIAEVTAMERTYGHLLGLRLAGGRFFVVTKR